MFGELPKLFDRDFAIAYFLPSAAFVSATHFVATHLHVAEPRFILSKDTLLPDLTAFGLLALLGAVVLSVLNRIIVRLMEGYWPFNLGRKLNFIEKWRYRTLLKKEETSDRQRKLYSSENFPKQLRLARNKLKLEKANRFPHMEDLILPTSFGNAFRAFEVYSGVVYGVDAIPAWTRLLAVVPPDYRKLIDGARASVDLWINLSFIGVLVTVEYTYIFIWGGGMKPSWPSQGLSWFPVITLSVAYASYRLARSAVSEWGHWVKSAFDLYLPSLRKILEFPLPPTREAEKRMWTDFSRAAIYRDGAMMPAKSRNPADDSNNAKHEADTGSRCVLLVTKKKLKRLRRDPANHKLQIIDCRK